MSSTPKMLHLTAEIVKRVYHPGRVLGEGSDGIVQIFHDRKDNSRQIAVKYPIGTKTSSSLMTELAVLQHLQKHQRTHENIVTMLGFDKAWIPHSPAIFMDYCELGDLWHYRLSVSFFEELTLWKLFADMAKGLHFLHAEQPVPILHGDFKPLNILVQRPPGNTEKIVVLPIFKLADFARATPMNRQVIEQTKWKFAGTPEYAPCRAERKNATLAADIWACGATLQFFAFGRNPTVSMRKFRQQHPELDALNDEQIRYHLPFKFRPLTAGPDVQVNELDVSKEYQSPGYSERLNKWYSLCVQPDIDSRITAHELMEAVVPVAESKIKIGLAKRAVEEHQLKLEKLKKPGKSAVAPPEKPTASLLAPPPIAIPPTVPPRPQVPNWMTRKEALRKAMVENAQENGKIPPPLLERRDR
ncbi:kinase-like protein [Polyplosphaeria fusca]|uniref:Kinase-like protein n=1 Tax=Polyplosphaeria fusca TaxID=682080 RepID=A0A9P4R6E9_9PLEO|nr:kinase-like protein [Polyplosphaeria fusca]